MSTAPKRTKLVVLPLDSTYRLLDPDAPLRKLRGSTPGIRAFIGDYQEVATKYNRDGVYIQNGVEVVEISGKAYKYVGKYRNVRKDLRLDLRLHLHRPLSNAEVQALELVRKHKLASRRQLEMLEVHYLLKEVRQNQVHSGKFQLRFNKKTSTLLTHQQ